MRFSAVPEQLPSAKAWGWLFVFVPALHNYWIDAQMRRASAKSILLTVPGLSNLVCPGHKLRAQLQFDPNVGAALVPLADVSLSEHDRLVRRWMNVPVEINAIR